MIEPVRNSVYLTNSIFSTFKENMCECYSIEYHLNLNPTYISMIFTQNSDKLFSLRYTVVFSDEGGVTKKDIMVNFLGKNFLTFLQ